MALKILVAGDVDGKFNQLFNRVKTVNKKNGPFEMLLCVGSFFGEDNSEWDEYATSTNEVPITTYILGPIAAEHSHYFLSDNGCELCPNVIYLGKKGMLTGSTGLKIAYLSGLESKDGAKNSWNYTREDVQNIEESVAELNFFPGIDVLVTSQWPKNVFKYAGTPEGFDNEKSGSDLVARLAYSIRPRYHFSGIEGIHYERLPYRNHKVLSEKPRHATRFVALAKVSNTEKQKWLYAFTITPTSAMDVAELNKQPPDVTECPYNFTEQDFIQADKVSKENQFFYDLESDRDHGNRKRGHGQMGGRRPRPPPRPHGPCWFCLASPEVEKHLAVSVGDTIYVALAKGGLSPDHVLILPIGHYQSTVELADDILDEIEKYKTALKKFFSAQDKTVVFFERNYRTTHLQIQVVPLPVMDSGKLKTTIQEYASYQSIELDEIPKHTDLKQVVSPGCPYFYMELQSGEKFLHRVRSGFSLHFGREILAAGILGIPEKIDWKNCKSSKEEETEMAAKFKTAFEPYDFTL